MEFVNVVNSLKEGKPPSYNNSTKNCSISKFRIQFKDFVNKNEPLLK